MTDVLASLRQRRRNAWLKARYKGSWLSLFPVETLDYLDREVGKIPKSDGFRFAPWIDFAHVGGVETEIPVEGPPCTHCRHWRPVTRRYPKSDGGFGFDGVRLCHADDQYQDFSCFEPKPDAREVAIEALTTGLTDRAEANRSERVPSAWETWR